MKIVFFLFALSSLFADEAYEAMEGRVRFEEEALIAFDGTRYPLYPYESRLHYDLGYALKDPVMAKQIHDAFLHHLTPLLSVEAMPEGLSFISEYRSVYAPPEYGKAKSATDAFTRALVGVCQLFGHPTLSPIEGLVAALKDQGVYGEELVRDHFEELNAFVDEANRAAAPPHVKRKRVVILTTTASGGNHSVANALAAELGNVSVVVDVEEIYRERDPIMLATGTDTFDSIYSLHFQRTTDLSILAKREIFARKIQRFIPSTVVQRLREKMVELEADFVISTRTYSTEDFGVAALGIPMRMFHTEMELCPVLGPYYGKVDPRAIRFWLPIDEPSFFKCFFDWHETQSGTAAELMGLDEVAFRQQFEVLGYPVCPEFYRITDPDRIASLKTKWGVNEGEIPIYVLMGKHGTGALIDLYEELPCQFPVKYLFICGKNRAIKEELEARPPNKAFSILGLLSPTEMNEVMNICDLGITKTGGPAITEPLTTGTPLLIMHIHPWEIVNAEFMANRGYAALHDPATPLQEQIEAALKIRVPEYPKPLSEWKTRLPDLVFVKNQ